MKRSLVRDIRQTQLAIILAGAVYMASMLGAWLFYSTVSEQKRTLLILTEAIESAVNRAQISSETWDPTGLLPELERVFASFPPGIVGGFYSKALNQVTLSYSRSLPIDMVGLSLDKNNPGKQSWETGKSQESLFYSSWRQTWLLECANPVIIDGVIVGHVFANLTLTNILLMYLPAASVLLLCMLGCLVTAWLINRRAVGRILHNIRALKLINRSDNALDFDYLEFDEVARANHKTYQELELAEKQKAELLKRLPWGYLIANCAGICVDVNEQGTNILSLDKQRTIGQKMDPENYSLIYQVLRDKIPIETEGVVKTPKGTVVLYSSAFPVQLDSGEEGVMICFVDVTENKALEAKVHQMDRLSMLGEMTSIIAHDIRNPLASIKGLAQLSELTDELSEQRNICQRINLTVNDINQYLERILFFSQPDRAQQGGGPCSARYMFENIVLMLQGKFTSAGIALEVEVAEPEPELYVNSLDFQHVLLNLVNNALEAMTLAKSTGKVVMRAENDGDGVRLEVTDQGPGIAVEHLARIWDMFYTTKPSGNGLGLAMAKKVIEQHHGTIEVKSSPQGTIFTIWIPGKQADDIPA